MAAVRSIDIRTELPGPRSRAILERKEHAVARPLALAFPVVVDRADGARLTDVDGNTFLDFTGGVGCLAVGHAHPQVVEAAKAQLDRFLHTDFTMIPYEVYVELAERLLAVAPFHGPAKAAFFNSGAEAVENAVKIARAATGRPAVIAFDGAFHGRTLMALTLTSKAHPYKAGLGPFASEVYRAPSRTPTAAPPARRPWLRSSAPSTRTSRPRRSRPSSSSPSRARPASCPRPRRSCRACAGSATSTASCWSATRCRPVSGAPAACSPWSTAASSPT